MIVEFLMSVISALVQGVLGLIPSIPAMPGWVDTAADYLLNSLAGVVGILVYLYTSQLFLFVLTTFVVIIGFEHLYHLAMWIIRKLPTSIH